MLIPAGITLRKDIVLGHAVDLMTIFRLTVSIAQESRSIGTTVVALSEICLLKLSAQCYESDVFGLAGSTYN